MGSVLILSTNDENQTGCYHYGLYHIREYPFWNLIEETLT